MERGCGKKVAAGGPQINISAQRNWLHVSSDGSCLAIIWKHGGLDMDTDVISIRPIPEENFLAAQASQYARNGVFGFLPHHTFLWECMENFAEHYKSYIWGNQGSNLMKRMLRMWCKLEDFQGVSNLRYSNSYFLHPQRFYPFSYPEWRHYYEVWDTDPSFSDSYALHLWNYMNQEGKGVVRGINMLAKNLCHMHCPRTYRDLVQGPAGLVTGKLGLGNKYSQCCCEVESVEIQGELKVSSTYCIVIRFNFQSLQSGEEASDHGYMCLIMKHINPVLDHMATSLEQVDTNNL
ncbi:alpha-1,4-N-acetylglucosaminyltransferase-like [Glossophaga mutica]